MMEVVIAVAIGDRRATGGPERVLGGWEVNGHA